MRELISDIRCEGGRVDVRASADFHDRFLRSDFFAEYDPSPRSIPPEIAVLPFVANVAPIAWLSGQTWSVPVLDAAFATALEDLKSVFAGFYPSLPWTGRVVAERVVPGPAEGDDADAPRVTVLFSGGLDSMYSSLDHRHEHQQLVSVWGNGLVIDNVRGWEVLQRNLQTFAAEWGHRPAVIRTNFREFLDLPTLESRWLDGGNWWPDVQVGLGLIGLTAPLVPRGVGGRVVIAGTRTPAFPEAHGTTPVGDQLIRWADVTVEHNGYEVSRQAKLESVWSILDAAGSAATLHVCYSNPYGEGTNCGRCEKCLRTAVGGLIAGSVDRLGFKSPRLIVRRTRRRFATYRVPMASRIVPWWVDLKDQAARLSHSNKDRLERDPMLAELVEWLAGFDFDEYARRWETLATARRRLIRLARRSRTVEAGLKRARSLWLRVSRSS